MNPEQTIAAFRERFGSEILKRESTYDTSFNYYDISEPVESFLLTALQEAEKRGREEEQKRLLRVAREKSVSAYFFMQGADLVKLEDLFDQARSLPEEQK